MQTQTLQQDKKNLWALKKPNLPSVKKTPSSFEVKEGASSSPVNTQVTQDVNRDIYDSWQNFLTASSDPKSYSESNLTNLQATITIGGLNEISFQKKSNPAFMKQSKITYAISKGKKVNIKKEFLEIAKKGAKEISFKNLNQSIKQTREFATEAKKLFLYIFFGIDKGNLSKEPQSDNNPNIKEKNKFNPILYMSRFARNVVSMENITMLKAQRESVNARLKLSNLSYEGFVLDNGQVRIDVLAALDRANSELEKADLKKKREIQVAKATKGKSLTYNLNAQEGNSIVANQIATAG